VEILRRAESLQAGGWASCLSLRKYFKDNRVTMQEKVPYVFQFSMFPGMKSK